MRPRDSLREALILGLVQGPTELLPVSSSAHIALLARLTRRPQTALDAELHDSLEVALHAGTAVALLIAGRDELVRTARELNRAHLLAGALALSPPALAGYLLERSPDRRPGSPRTIATGLALGAVAMAAADTKPQHRTVGQVRPLDGLALGFAQTVALLPGVSRNGATLTVARARGFAREDAQALSWRVGLPVIVGASGLKALRLARDGVPAGGGGTLAVGAAAALLSTLAGAPLIRPGRRGRRLLPFALYRLALAVVAVTVPNRLRSTHNRSR